MPILGIIASSNQQGRGGGPVGAYDSLATVTLSSAVSTVTFAGIPSGYKHLQIRSIARTNNGANVEDIVAVFNGDTGSNYSQHLLVGNGSTAASYSATSASYVKGVSYATGTNASANIFGAGVMDILDYASTNKNKVTRAITGVDLNLADTTAQLQFFSSMWINTSAITSITIKTASGSNINTYSQFALYGVK